jgi:hypothetical protein
MFSSSIEAEKLALMQIKKRGCAARVGAFGEHFLPPLGRTNLVNASYRARSEMHPLR